ncbi:hypothetical protein V6N13_072461 [Hibiscus sabdariffa]
MNMEDSDNADSGPNRPIGINGLVDEDTYDIQEESYDAQEDNIQLGGGYVLDDDDDDEINSIQNNFRLVKRKIKIKVNIVNASDFKPHVI